MPRLLHRAAPPIDGAYTLNRDSIQSVGLALAWLDPTSRADLSERTGQLTPSGTKIVGAAVVNSARGFNATLGSASTDKITTGLTAHATYRTYTCWVYRRGGAAEFGRVFDKLTAGVSVEQFIHADDVGTPNMSYTRVASGTDALAEFVGPNPDEWHLLAVTHDTSAIGNLPQMFDNGVEVSYSVQVAATGTFTTNTDPYVIGNRGSDNARCWDGYLRDFRVYDRVLSPQEIWQLYDPETRWDLYLPTRWRTFAIGAAPPVPIAATATQGNSIAMLRKPLRIAAISEGNTVTTLRRVARVTLVTEASTATFIRRVNRVITVTAGVTVTFLRRVSRFVALTQTSTASFALTVFRVISATVTQGNAVVIIKRINRVVSVSQGSTITMIRRVFKIISVANTPIIVALRSLPRQFAVTQASTVTFIRRVSRFADLSASHLVTVALSYRRLATVTQASIVTFTRQLGRIISATQAATASGFRTVLREILVQQGATSSSDEAVIGPGGTVGRTALALANSLVSFSLVIARRFQVTYRGMSYNRSTRVEPDAPEPTNPSGAEYRRETHTNG